MATNIFSQTEYEKYEENALLKLDDGTLSIDLYNFTYGDVPVFKGDDGYYDTYRENTSQIRDWAKNNFDKLDVSTGDFKIKAEHKGEFVVTFPKRKVVQIPANAQGGNLTPDEQISYTNLAKDAGILLQKSEIAAGINSYIIAEYGYTARDDGKTYLRADTPTKFVRLQQIASLNSELFRNEYNTARANINYYQSIQYQSQGEKALWNSRQVEFEGDTPTNLTSEEMEGSVVPSNIWDNYPAVLPDTTTTITTEVATESDTEANTNETFVDEQGNSTNVSTDDSLTLNINNAPELYGVVPSVTESAIQQENATATIQQETDVVQNLRNIDYFMNPPGQPAPNVLHAFSSYNVNFDFFMMTPYDYNEVVDMLAGVQYNTTVYSDFTNKPYRRLFGSSGIRTTNSTADSSNNPNFRKEYHIENVELQSYVSPSKTNGGSKFTTGTMTVFEPYGSTLLENIVKASVDGSINPPSPNYLQIPYMLKISFKGYDDQGNPLDTTFLRPKGSESASTSFSQDPGTKYLTVKISNLTFKVTPEGSEYTIEFYNFDADTLQDYYGSLPHGIQVNEGTLGSFFGISGVIGPSGNESLTEVEDAGIKVSTRESGTLTHRHTERIETPFFKARNTAKNLPEILNRWEEEKVKSGAQEQADKFSFRYDPGEFPNENFLDAPLAKPNKMNVNNVPVTSDKIKVITENQRLVSGFSTAPSEAGKQAYQFGKGTSVLSVIHTAIATSSFMTNQVEIVETDVTSAIDPGLRRAKFGNDWAQAQVTRKDYKLSGTKTGLLLMYKVTPRVKLGEYDFKRNTYAKEIIYVISLYNREGESATNVKKSPVDNVVKRYDYLYTGKNKDVLNFDLEFNSGFFSKKIIGSFANQMASLRDNERETRPVSPSGVGDSDNPTGSKAAVKPVTENPNALTQGDSNDPATLIIGELMSKIYEGGADLLSAELEIMGDPQFIIQEEAFGRDAHASHFAPNGSVSTHRDPIIQINIYTPSDIQGDGTITPTSKKTGTRAVGPGGQYTETYQYDDVNDGVSVFSGRYRVLTIETSFNGNEFTQRLNLVKIGDEDKDNVLGPNPTATNNILYTSYSDEIGAAAGR